MEILQEWKPNWIQSRSYYMFIDISTCQKYLCMSIVRMSISLSKAGTGDDLCESKFCNYLQIHQPATLLLGKIAQIATTFKARMWLRLISFELNIVTMGQFCNGFSARSTTEFNFGKKGSAILEKKSFAIVLVQGQQLNLILEKRYRSKASSTAEFN